MTMELPAARTAPKVVGMPKKGLMLAVGHPKSGKTWFAASAPKSLVIELEEGGADRVPGGRILEVSCTANTVAEAKAAIERFDEAMTLAMQSDDVEIVTIDSVDQLARMHIVELGLANKPAAGFDSRTAWGEFASRMHTITDAMKTCGKLVILIAHCKPPEKDNEGRVITPAGINVAGKGAAYICAQAEMIGFIGVRVLAGKAQHYIRFKSDSDLAIWRSRVDELHEKEIVLDKSDPWGSFAAAFGPAKAAETKKEAKKK